MRAQDVGWSANRLVLGKHSGRNAFRSRLEQLGIVLSSEARLAFQAGVFPPASSTYRIYR